MANLCFKDNEEALSFRRLGSEEFKSFREHLVRGVKEQTDTLAKCEDPIRIHKAQGRYEVYSTLLELINQADRKVGARG